MKNGSFKANPDDGTERHHKENADDGTHRHHMDNPDDNSPVPTPVTASTRALIVSVLTPELWQKDVP
jgi:hypothetical protein